MQQVTTRNDPAPSRLTYRLQRLMLTPLFRILLRVGVPFCVTFTVATVYLSDAGRQEAIQTAIADLRKQIETRPEFMVNELTVEGASAGVEDDIREIFPFDLPSSSFDIDLEHVRNMIVGLPAVAEASVRVRQGGVLVAQVKEREPVVVWRTWDGLGLVDKDGYVVSEIASRLERADLPVIAGKGGSKDVSGALDILQAAAPLGDRVKGLVRMGERRWDVVMDRGQRILLPETDAVQALERAMAMDGAVDMLSRDIAAVDLRLAQRPTLRLSAMASQEYWRIKAMETGDQRQ